MSDSINEQRCEHGELNAHGNCGLPKCRECLPVCPGPSVVTPPAEQPEPSDEEKGRLASEAVARVLDLLDAVLTLQPADPDTGDRNVSLFALVEALEGEPS